MRYAFMFVGLGGLTAFGLYACGTAGPSLKSDDADSGTEAGFEPDTGMKDSGADAGMGDGTSCAKAIAVDLGIETKGALDTSGKVIFYSIKVTAGDFLSLTAATAATQTTVAGEVVDTAISLYDSTGAKLLANDDDAFPRYTSDAMFFYRAPETGTLCVRVTDFDTWKGDSPKVATDPNFKFSASILNPEADNVTLDKESNDTLATSQVSKLKGFGKGYERGGYQILAGGLSSASDVDVYKFTVPTGARMMKIPIPPIGAPLAAGQPSYGSTMARFTAIVKQAGGTIVAELAPPAGQVESMPEALYTPVGLGEYYLGISRPTEVTAGTNDFYATTVYFFETSSPPELEITAGHSNDTLVAAEALTMTADTSNAKVKRGYILGYLPAGDVADNFSFVVGAGDAVEMGCGAGREGSGLQSFKMEVFVGGSSKQSETETAAQDLWWSSAATGAAKSPTKPGIKVSASGTAVLQLTAAGRSTTNTGTYYECGVHVTSP